ncbi:unnamed protein product [Candidula unifasciata]|uniref:RNA methyltransferase n=1 Tax=Candidula unifasciata TaxID=100452 RepID=A0A8S3YUM9_9EUPU|nr:unnamed protein product [Candidula unifasciata]
MEELPSVEASEYGGETKSSPLPSVYEHIEGNRCVNSATEREEGHLGIVESFQVKDTIPPTVSSVVDSDSNSRQDLSSNGERNYESEPVSAKKIESPQKKKGNRGHISHQGKTMFPRPQTLPMSKELRELTRKHALLEKNLKIDGLPDPFPKFRKRRLSLSSNVGRPHDKDAPVYKRKRLVSVDTRPKRDHMPKWELMGGDAHDPLNLNGLAHSEEGRLLNSKTPESSPLRTPDFRKIVYVKVPPNIEDPLNLEGKHDQSVIDKMLNSTVKKRHRSKKKKNDDSHQTVPETVAAAQLCTVNSVEESAMEASVPQSEPQAVKQGAKEDLETKTMDVSTTPTKLPVPISRRSRSRSLSMSPERKFRRQLSGGKGKAGPNEPKKFPEKPKFTLGNYNRYYGYRNKDSVPDPRLQYFDPSWFKGRDVLDIGCNVGHITLAVAEHFQPHKILGMDIDGKLIQAARQNIRHMLSLRRKDSSKYPTSFEMIRGPREAHPLMGLSDNFPNNVLFLQGNYVPGSEEILNLQKEEFDTILALSITKWIHLNSGDDGLKLFFQKIFRQLRPGGRLILEPQPWSTYRKRAKLTPEMFAKYQAIKLKPEGFKHYLLSIGFVKCEVVGVPVTKSKGFRRPLILFTKSDNRQTPNVVVEEVDVREVCQECGSTNKNMCHHPQFTGMRRGPYASLMYDHFNYPYASSDSPYVSSSRTYANCGYSFNMPGSEDLLGPLDSGDGSSDISAGFQSNGERWGSSERSDTSTSSSNRSVSSSSHSSSYESQSGSSSSSRSYGSSDVNGSDTPWSSSSSYFSPAPSGANGNVSGLQYNPNNARLNGDIAHEFDSPDHNGPHGEFASDYVSPEPAVPVDMVVEEGSPQLIESSINEDQMSQHNTLSESMDIASDNDISKAVVRGDIEHDDDDVPYSGGGGDDNDLPEEGEHLVLSEQVYVSYSVDGDVPEVSERQIITEAAYISNSASNDVPEEGGFRVVPEPANILNSVDSDAHEERDNRVVPEPAHISDSASCDALEECEGQDIQEPAFILNSEDSALSGDGNHRVVPEPVRIFDSVDNDVREDGDNWVLPAPGHVSDSVDSDIPGEDEHQVVPQIEYIADAVNDDSAVNVQQPLDVDSQDANVETGIADPSADTSV